MATREQNMSEWVGIFARARSAAEELVGGIMVECFPGGKENFLSIAIEMKVELAKKIAVERLCAYAAQECAALQAALTASETNEVLTRHEEEQATLEANALRHERDALQQRVEALEAAIRSRMETSPNGQRTIHGGYDHRIDGACPICAALPGGD